MVLFLRPYKITSKAFYVETREGQYETMSHHEYLPKSKGRTLRKWLALFDQIMRPPRRRWYKFYESFTLGLVAFDASLPTATVSTQK